MAGEKDVLRNLLIGESRAYGFTIAFWGSGSMLIREFGLPTFGEAIVYGTGAITGFGILAIIAFESSLTRFEDEKGSTVVLSMFHFMAALLPIIAAHLLVSAFSNPITAFFTTGLSVSIVYNSLSVIEDDMAELIS